jgi:Winged helix DNA-binding domain
VVRSKIASSGPTMNRLDIVRRRLANSYLTRPDFDSPADVVARFGAVQSQDYAGAKWGVAQRMRSAVDTTVDRAFNEGAIIRTHVLRPTWHFVAPEDLRWMLKLTAPRVNAASAYMHREFELDAAVFRKSNATFEKVLRDGKQLTREELREAFKRARVTTGDSIRFGYLLMRAELDAVICSGPRRGKQFTYALVDERVPPGKNPDRDEALFELAFRYFTTRGPATIHDFAWWSGLTIADARKAQQAAASRLEHATYEGQPYWFADNGATAPARSRLVHLLPNYDEYFIGFRDRSAIQADGRKLMTRAASVPLLAHIVFIDGLVVGGWRRTLGKGAVRVELNPLTSFSAAERRAIANAAEGYGAFLGLPVELVDR